MDVAAGLSKLGNIDWATWLSDSTAVVVQQDLLAAASRRWSTWRRGWRWRSRGGGGTRGAQPPWPRATPPWRTATGPTAGRSCAAPWPSWGRPCPGVRPAPPRPALRPPLPSLGGPSGESSGQRTLRLPAWHRHAPSRLLAVGSKWAALRMSQMRLAVLCLQIRSARCKRTPDACEPGRLADTALVGWG